MMRVAGLEPARHTATDFPTTLCHHSHVCVVVWTMSLPCLSVQVVGIQSIRIQELLPLSSALSCVTKISTELADIHSQSFLLQCSCFTKVCGVCLFHHTRVRWRVCFPLNLTYLVQHKFLSLSSIFFRNFFRNFQDALLLSHLEHLYYILKFLFCQILFYLFNR